VFVSFAQSNFPEYWHSANTNPEYEPSEGVVEEVCLYDMKPNSAGDNKHMQKLPAYYGILCSSAKSSRRKTGMLMFLAVSILLPMPAIADTVLVAAKPWASKAAKKSTARSAKSNPSKKDAAGDAAATDANNSSGLTPNAVPSSDATGSTLPAVPSTSSGDLNKVPNLDSLGALTPPPLPPEPAVNHSANRTMDIGPVQVGPLIQIASLKPIRLEASYNEPLTLRDALIYSIDNNLPIKVSRETWNSQRYLFNAALGGFLPNFSMNYNLTHTRVFPSTTTNSRVFQVGLSQPVFQGGRVLYGALAQYYRQKGWNYSYRGTINDTLLDVYSKYNNLLLNRALLQIRIKSVETSEAQLRLNEQLYSAGTGTRFAVMQSRTQLALDRQSLLLQQVAVRQSAIALAFSMNLPLAINAVPAETSVTESALVDESLNINDLLNTSLVRRPELRQYEFFRLAAARNVQVQAAQYYPTVTIFGQYNRTSVDVHGNGGGGSGNNSASSVSNNPSGGGTFPSVQSTVNPTVPSSNSNTNTSTQAANSSNAANGTFQAGTQQSGALIGGASTGTSTTGLSQSGLSSPGGASANPGSFGASGANAQLGNTGVGGFSGGNGITNSASFGVQMNWSLAGLGYTTSQNILSARALARQALLQANQQLLLVSQQVRSSYLNALTAREQIDVAAAAVASSGEALRLANLRVQTGVGTNLELIQAQRDYITALVNQAQAIISSNQAQAQLLRDTGLISVETLTSGYHPRIGSLPDSQTH
jgi:outer membrane protein TolC